MHNQNKNTTKAIVVFLMLCMFGFFANWGSLIYSILVSMFVIMSFISTLLFLISVKCNIYNKYKILLMPFYCFLCSFSLFLSFKLYSALL